MKVIYMSGYTDTTVTHRELVDEGVNFLQKPLVPDVLARKVREVLDSAA
jgi:FixJ family two-component response regulator